MFSNLTIISVFNQLMAVGVLIFGGVSFLSSFFSQRRLKEFFLGLFYFSLLAYVGFYVTSELMYDWGRGVAEVVFVQKGLSTCLVFCSIFLWFYILEKFELKKFRFFSLVILSLAGFFLYQVVDVGANLFYFKESVLPIVNYSSLVLIEPFFVVICLIAAGLSFRDLLFAKGGKRGLAGYSLGAFLGFPLSLLFSFYYISSGAGENLVISWCLFIFSALAILPGELIPPEEAESWVPLSFLRARILFKLMLIFVFLVVVPFEVTTLLTIGISKNSLSRSIQAEFLKVAENIVEEIETFNQPPSLGFMESLMTKIKLGKNGVAFLVDREGTVVFASVEKQPSLSQNKNMHLSEAVRRVLSGQKGTAEFRDENGINMVGAYISINKFGWGLVVQEPVNSAYYEMRQLEANLLLFVMAAITITALIGVYFVRSIEKPIRALTLGTEAVAKGELGCHIPVNSVDEIGKLAEAFNRMTKDLRDSQERLILSEKLASLGTMAAGMAHEIKNPLVSLRTFTQLLQQKWDDKEFRDKFSSIIPHEIERINRIAESLLKFGRPVKPELTKVDINSILDEVLLLFESECKKNNVRVTKKLTELPNISGDPGLLSQAFVNIVKNAIESMEEKGGDLLVKTDVGEVIKLGEKEAQKGDERVWGGEGEELSRPLPAVFIEVSDTGEGIGEGELKNLFDPFFTTKMKGTGMGLPITLRIIEEHKGSIKVKSQLGRGTTFIVTLPQGS